MPWYVYILRCEPDTLYTGSTPDMERRLRQHLSQVSGGAKYTRSHPPRSLAALWEVPDAHAAHSLEWHIKRLKRPEKDALLQDPARAASLLGASAENAVPLDPQAYHGLFAENP